MVEPPEDVPAEPEAEAPKPAPRPRTRAPRTTTPRRRTTAPGRGQARPAGRARSRGRGHAAEAGAPPAHQHAEDDHAAAPHDPPGRRRGSHARHSGARPPAPRRDSARGPRARASGARGAAVEAVPDEPVVEAAEQPKAKKASGKKGKDKAKKGKKKPDKARKKDKQKDDKRQEGQEGQEEVVRDRPGTARPHRRPIAERPVPMPTAGTQYLLPQDRSPGKARAALAKALRLQAGPARTVDRTLYDTFDGRLHRRGLLLAHEDGRLCLRDAEAERASAAHTARPRRLFTGDLPPGDLRDLAAPIVEMRALMPIVRIHTRLEPLRVLDGDAKTVVRLVLEEPALVGAAGRRTRLRTRLHVTGVRGYDKALARVHRVLGEQLGLDAAGQSLADEAVLAAGGVPGGVSSGLKVALRPDEPADGAAAALLLRLLGTIEQNLPGTLADVDSEFLHDLRVGVRRSRSAQRQLARVFPPEPLARFRAEFRRLQQVTGPTRDLDVYLLELDDFSSALAGERPPRPGAGPPPAGRAPPPRAAADGPRAALGPHGLALRRVGRVPRRARRAAAGRPARRAPPDRRGGRRADPRRLPPDGEGGRRDRRRQPAGGAARAAQDGQGAPLPARVLRRPLPGHGREADDRGRSRRCRTRSAASRTGRSRRRCCAAWATRSPRSSAAPPR